MARTYMGGRSDDGHRGHPAVWNVRGTAAHVMMRGTEELLASGSYVAFGEQGAPRCAQAVLQAVSRVDRILAACHAARVKLGKDKAQTPANSFQSATFITLDRHARHARGVAQLETSTCCVPRRRREHLPLRGCLRSIQPPALEPRTVWLMHSHVGSA